MKKTDRKVELLAPVGNFEKLEIAIHYGADAVYLAGKEFSLRSFSDNFTIEELKHAADYSHDNDVRVYLACNIFARTFEQAAIAEYLNVVGSMGIDAIIISDPGIFRIARRLIPHVPIHISTQANTTNLDSILFWADLGASRVNLARELSLKEIKEIIKNSSAGIEVFIHGAMCVAYSGRCLLSSFLTGRESNRGMCTHPCRWNYALVEETRPGEYMPIAEDARGTYILNSRDLCMIEHLPEVIETGVASLKIEGRMKGINYVATAVKVYREAIDAYYNDPLNFKVNKHWIKELDRIGRRGYSTGFYFEDPSQIAPNVDKAINVLNHTFVAKVLEPIDEHTVTIHVRNKIYKDDDVDIFTRSGPARLDKIKEIVDENGQSINYAQPGSKVTIRLNSACLTNDLIRRVEPDSESRYS